MLSLNVSSMFTRVAGQNAKSVSKSMERLSSAQRVNRASDDAAGLSIAESLRTQVRGSAQAARNIQDGIGLVQFGMDGVQSGFSVLQRIRELILQAANDTNDDTSLDAIQGEIDSIKRQIPEIYKVGQLSRLNFDGNPYDRQLDFQIGANEGETMRTDFNPLRDDLLKTVLGAFGYNELYNSEYKGLATSATYPAPPPPPTAATDAMFPKKLVVKPNTQANITTALNFVDDSLGKLVGQANYLGGQINRLEHTLNNVTNYELQAGEAESRIRDADMADETTKLAKSQIMQKSSLAMVAQANVKPTLLLEFVQNTSEDETRSLEAGASG